MANPTDFNITPRNGRTYFTKDGSSSPSDILLFMGEVSTKHEKLVKEIKSMLRIVVKDSFESLVMIDTLQHLGIGYLFQEEVQEILDIQYSSSISLCSTDCDLFEVSTRFRVLREEGYNVTTDIFNKFIDQGKLKPQLREDIRGLISFYEASQLSIDGEEVLDQAADSCSHFLNESIPYLDHNHAKAVTNMLQYPYQKSFAKSTTKNLLSKGKPKWIEASLELAKLNMEMIHESIHKKEVNQVMRWWNDIGLAKELMFIRDQPLKWYIWSMTTLTDPRLSEERIQLTKQISFVYIIDDIFDVYGTLEDLTSFTEAVNRWELDDLKQLPHSMAVCFEALYHVTNEFSNKIYQTYGWNPINLLRKAWGNLCNAFLVEARWFASEELPTAEEYLKNGIISSGVQVIATHMFFLLGGGIDDESAKILDTHSELINSVAMILRLWDDLGSAKDENQDGKDGSYVEYYMNENKGCTAETAKKHVMEMISKAWKSLNKEYLRKSPFSKAFKKSCLNGARMVLLMYNYDEKQRLPLLEEYMKSMEFNRHDINDI